MVLFLGKYRIKNSKKGLVRPSTFPGKISVFTQELLPLAFVAGNIGSELSYTDIGMFISSDGGNSWRQVCFAESRKARNILLLFLLLAFLFQWSRAFMRCLFCLQIFEEEYNVWFLDWGGALVALKQTSVPIRHLW